MPLTIQKVNAKLLKDEHMEDLLERFVQLCVVQHVHDDDLKALYRDYERLLALSRFDCGLLQLPAGKDMDLGADLSASSAARDRVSLRRRRIRRNTDH